MFDHEANVAPAAFKNPVLKIGVFLGWDLSSAGQLL